MLSIGFGLLMGLAALLLCGFFALVVAVATGMLRFGICGLTDGPNQNPATKALLPGIVIVGPLAAAVWSYSRMKTYLIKSSPPVIENTNPGPVKS